MRSQSFATTGRTVIRPVVAWITPVSLFISRDDCGHLPLERQVTLGDTRVNQFQEMRADNRERQSQHLNRDTIESGRTARAHTLQRKVQFRVSGVQSPAIEETRDIIIEKWVMLYMH